VAEPEPAGQTEEQEENTHAVKRVDETGTGIVERA